MNKSLKTLFLFNGIFVFAGSLLGPLYALYVANIGKSVLVVSTSWSVYLASATLCTLILSKYGDRVKEKERLLMAGYLIRGLVWIAYIFVGNFTTLLVLQFVLGIGEALGTPAYDTIFAEHLDRNKHIKDYSTWKVISNLLGAAATFLGGLVVTYSGFIPLFMFMAILAFTSFLGVGMSPRKLYE